ncbi:glycosyltransferase family 2 protein [Nibrella viscosa]
MNYVQKEWSIYRKRTRYASMMNKSSQILKLLNKNTISTQTVEFRLFAIMRNESLRLPYFLSYYKNLGVDRFFLIDNNSNDGSAELALTYQNVHVFQTTDSYTNHWYWTEHLLENYGKNYWCLVVDIDELFAYPFSNQIKLNKLCQYLDDKKQTAMCSLLLDMYANKEVRVVQSTQNANPLNILTYFDADYYTIPFTFLNRSTQKAYSFPVFTGGMRDRIFGKSTPPALLSKVSIFKNIKGTYLSQGMHAIDGAILSELQGIVFHTKFLSDFVGEVEEECRREEHYGNAFYYKLYQQKLQKHPKLNLYHPGSVKYEGLEQLEGLGLIKSSPAYDAYVKHLIQGKSKPDETSLNHV